MQEGLMFLIVGFVPILANWLYSKLELELVPLTTVNRVLDALIFFCVIGLYYILLIRP